MRVQYTAAAVGSRYIWKYYVRGWAKNLSGLILRTQF